MGKRATAKEVAERAGVSRTTVSFVLNNVAGMRISEETRQNVMQAAQALDYHHDATARRMATGGGSNCACVRVENQGGAARARRPLIGRGHQRIALIPNEAPVYTASADRLAG